jgi:hypothetical protein
MLSPHNRLHVSMDSSRVFNTGTSFSGYAGVAVVENNMKKLFLVLVVFIIMMALAHNVHSQTCEVNLMGKVADGNYRLVRGAENVFFVSNRGIYIVPIDRGGYTIGLPCSTSFRAGLISVNGWYWETQRFTTSSQNYDWLIMDFIAVPTTLRKKNVDRTVDLW